MRQESDEKDLAKEADSVMIMTTPPSKGVMSRKRKLVVEDVSPSAEVLSKKSFKRRPQGF